MRGDMEKISCVSLGMKVELRWDGGSERGRAPVDECQLRESI